MKRDRFLTRLKALLDTYEMNHAESTARGYRRGIYFSNGVLYAVDKCMRIYIEELERKAKQK